MPHKDKVGRLTRDQVREIATTKMPDLNANDLDAAMKIIDGTARSMGVTVDGLTQLTAARQTAPDQQHVAGPLTRPTTTPWYERNQT